MRKTNLMVGYGLLPLWASIAILVLGGAFSHSSEYWTAAPWIVIASVPICGATLLVSAITLVVHRRASGDEARRKAIAIKSFWGMNLVLVAIAGMWWLQSAKRTSDIESEKKRALEFVRSHETVVKRFGSGLDVSVATYTTSATTGPLPWQFEISIDTKRAQGADLNSRYVYAIVTVAESQGQRRLILDCITATSMGHRDPSKDPCRQ
jgi:hypothetical protein